MNETFNRWVLKEYDRFINRKKRNYLHFDLPIEAGLSISTFSIKLSKIVKVNNVIRHSFFPFLRVTKKSIKRTRDNGNIYIEFKNRNIDYSAHKDSIIYSWYSFLLSEKYDKKLIDFGLSDSVIAYRTVKDINNKGKNNISFAKEAIDFWLNNKNYVAIALDVKDFFGSIGHDNLRHKLEYILEVKSLSKDWNVVLNSIIHYHYINKSRMKGFWSGRRSLSRNGKICSVDDFRLLVDSGLMEKGTKGGRGIPQGSSISCMFANLYLLDFDYAINSSVLNCNGFYRRYSDDILIILPKDHADGLYKTILEKLKEIGLNISEHKTEKRVLSMVDGVLRCYDVDENLTPYLLKNFSYLGIEFNGYNYYLRHRGISRAQIKIVNSIKGASSYSIKNKLLGLPGKKIYRKYSVIKNTFREYRNRAAKILSSDSIKKQYSNFRVEDFIKRKKQKALTVINMNKKIK